MITQSSALSTGMAGSFSWSSSDGLAAIEEVVLVDAAQTRLALPVTRR